MPESRHGYLTTNEGIHVAYQWIFLNEADRLAKTDFVATDVGKMARQQDDNTLWLLDDLAPTWVAVTGVRQLSGLSDVDLDSIPLTDGQILSYNATYGVWQPTEIADFIGSYALDDLDDVDVTPSDGQLLSYNALSGNWIATDYPHTHPWSDITSGIPDFATRWPTWTEVTEKPTTFAPSTHAHDDLYYTEAESNALFAPLTHAHAWADITSGVPDFATRWPTWSEVTSKPTTFAYTDAANIFSLGQEINGILSVYAADSWSQGSWVFMHSSTVLRGAEFTAVRARGTRESPLAVEVGDVTSAWRGGGWSGSAYYRGSGMRTVVDSTISPTSVPQAVVLITGSTDNPNERLRVSSSGLVGINQTNPVSSQLEVKTAAVGTIGFLVDTIASPTANLLELRNNATVMFFVNKDGQVTSMSAQLDLDGKSLTAYQSGYIPVQQGTPTSLSDVAAYMDFDGQGPYNENFFGSLYTHKGIQGTPTGGVIHVEGKFGKAVQVAETTTNLVINPSFEVSTGTWASSWGDTLSRSSEQAKYGQYSLKITSDGVTNGQGAYCDIAVTAGQTYTVSCWVYVPSTYTGSNPSPRIYDGANFTTPLGSVAITERDQWVYWSTTQVISSTTLRFLFYATANIAAQAFYLDAVQVEQKVFATPYCDGSLGTGHTWSSTAHASTSSRTYARLSYSTPVKSPPLTVSLWYEVTAASQLAGSPYYYTNLIWSSDDANQANNRFVIQYNPYNNSWIFRSSNAAGVETSIAPANNTTLSLGWHHFAASIDAQGNGALYFDGVLIASSASMNVPSVMTGLFTIGRATGSGNADRGPNGLVDDVLVLNRVASADEIAAIYKSGAPIAIQSPYALTASSNTWQRSQTFSDNIGVGAAPNVLGQIYIVPATSKSAIYMTRATGQPSIKATDWLILDSTTNPVAINYYVSSHVVLAYGGGDVSIGTNVSPVARLDILTGSTTKIGIRVDTPASPTANLLELRSNTTKLFWVEANGDVFSRHAYPYYIMDMASPTDRATILFRELSGSYQPYNSVNAYGTTYGDAALNGKLEMKSSWGVVINTNGAPQFEIGLTGQIKVNQAVATGASTDQPSATAPYRLPIYNMAGALLGYIPIYSTWS